MNGPKPTVTVRPAKPEEYDAVADLTIDVYVGEGYTPREREPGLRDIAARAATSELLIAIDEASGEVLGAVSLVPKGGPFAQISEPGEAEFRLLAVSADARGRGIGRALVQECIDRARGYGCSRLVLWSQPTMAAAHRLYKQLGFERLPERDSVSPTGSLMLIYEQPL